LLGRLASWTIFEGLTERQNWQAPNDEPEHRDIKVEIKSSDPNKQGGGAALEPDRAQLSIFISALFRYAASGNFISLRSFHENRGSSKPFLIDPIKLNGVAFTLEEAAFNGARRAANAKEKTVFAPPIATFKGPDKATEADIAEGLVLSVECDQNPQQARRRLETLLGPATVVVRSGGVWLNPQTGKLEDKLHLHWRLAEPVSDKAAIAKLKRVRVLAARLVGADPSGKSIAHPYRWPGSVHRKAEPRLCAIEAAAPDAEIVLERCLEELETALGEARQGDPVSQETPPPDGERGRVDWENAFAKILAGDEGGYHPILVPLAASYAAWDVPEPATYNTLRSLLLNSNPQDPERTRRRDVELEKLSETVSSAYVKFDRTAKADSAAGSTAPGAPVVDLSLFGAEIPPPELTHDMLSADWVDLVWTSAAAAAAPPDYVAAVMVAAGAGAIGNARIVAIGSGWEEAIVLWMALVGPPSAHKSPAMGDVRKALTQIDRRLEARWRSECDLLEANYEIELAQATKKKSVKKPAKPPLPQLLHDDTTIEKLTVNMAGNPHGAIVCYDELASWLSSFTRYSADGDSSGARAFWNKAYSAGRHKRDRVKNEGPPIIVEAAACSVMGAIQPERLRQFWSTTNDGMLARLVPIWPQLAPEKAANFEETPAMHDHVATLKRAFQALYDLKLENDGGFLRPKAVPLSAAAQPVFSEAHLRCERAARRGRGVFAEWLGKGPGRILRLALVLEFMTWSLEPTAAEPEEISADAMARAIRYHSYLEAMFLRTLAGIEPAQAGADALAVAKLAIEKQWSHFANRDVGREPGFRWFRGEQKGDKERRESALKTLVDARAVRKETVKTSGGIFEKWAVNPNLEAALAARTLSRLRPSGFGQGL
jgi:hypothetical protein